VGVGSGADQVELSKAPHTIRRKESGNCCEGGRTGESASVVASSGDGLSSQNGGPVATRTPEVCSGTHVPKLPRPSCCCHLYPKVA
jgi:hypothetical protein